MHVRYKKKPTNFRARNKKILLDSIAILNEYDKLGYVLTLRGLYYQLIGRGLMEDLGNNDKTYGRVGRVLKNGRESGLVSWTAITDSTRQLRQLYKVASVNEALTDTLEQYHIDLWENQKIRFEIWVEKDALLPVIRRIANKHDIPYFSCRGYVSSSSIWQAGYIRFRNYIENNQIPIILQLSDLDPSGVNMYDDIVTRIRRYSGYDIQVKRLALTLEQVHQYNLPPNFAKLSDTRAGEFIANYGNNSYELDALAPDKISDLIETAIKDGRDDAKWRQALRTKEKGIKELKKVLEAYKEWTKES